MSNIFKPSGPIGIVDWVSKLMGRNQGVNDGFVTIQNDYTGQSQVPVDVGQVDIIPIPGATATVETDLTKTVTDPNLTTQVQSNRLMNYLNSINQSIDEQEAGVLAGQQARYSDLLYNQALRQGMSDPSGLTGGMAEQYSDKMSAAEIAAFGELDLQTESLLRDLEMMRIDAPFQAEQMVMEDWRNIAERIAFDSEFLAQAQDELALIDPEENPELYAAKQAEIQTIFDNINVLRGEQNQLFTPGQAKGVTAPKKPTTPEVETKDNILDYDPGFKAGVGGFATMEEVQANLIDAPVLGTQALGTFQRTGIALEQAAASSGQMLGNIPKDEVVFDSEVHNLLLRQYLSDTEGPVKIQFALNPGSEDAINSLIEQGVIPPDAVSDIELSDKAVDVGIGAGTGLLAASIAALILSLAAAPFTSGGTLSAMPAILSVLAPALAATGGVAGTKSIQIDRAIVENYLIENSIKYSSEIAAMTGG
jgi:hypothetical protein